MMACSESPHKKYCYNCHSCRRRRQRPATTRTRTTTTTTTRTSTLFTALQQLLLLPQRRQHETTTTNGNRVDVGTTRKQVRMGGGVRRMKRWMVVATCLLALLFDRIGSSCALVTVVRVYHPPTPPDTRVRMGIGNSKAPKEWNRRTTTSPSRPVSALATTSFLDDDSHSLETNDDDYLQMKRKKQEKNDSPKNQQQPQKQQRWVLLVDDEESIRRAVGQLLSNHGYQVTTCPDGTAALQVLQQPYRRLPDAVISDVRMPGGLDGWQLLQTLRHGSSGGAVVGMKQVPVILLTAQGLPQDRVRGYQAGADAYLPKPFDPEELLVLVDSVIQRRERLNGGTTTTSSSSSTTDGSTALVQDLRRSVQDIQRLLLETQPGNSNGTATGQLVLAPPERQVLELLCQGLRNKEIAERTYLSTRRVEQVLTTLYRRTKVKNRTELVRWAIATGTVKL